jgi:hypothetical protein
MDIAPQVGGTPALHVVAAQVATVHIRLIPHTHLILHLPTRREAVQLAGVAAVGQAEA